MWAVRPNPAIAAGTAGGDMSNFVQFPEDDYVKAGNVFADFKPRRQFGSPNALALMWFAQLAYEVDTLGNDPAAEAKVGRIAALAV
jgi:hypothetical protein